ncbi:hypothetical protein [Leptolyngbya ohadii]|uniref:hypothetical protein n=1 Tax=Leptolyngbya ohadii TaxID=1962290 RepID=UPI00117BACA4|nr:hypothetical protein [Leptolyngbya ohadii]
MRSSITRSYSVFEPLFAAFLEQIRSPSSDTPRMRKINDRPLAPLQNLAAGEDEAIGCPS